MTNWITSKHIDYMQYSVPPHTIDTEALEDTGKPVRNYDRAYSGTFGERYYAGNILNDSILVIYSSSALNELRKHITVPEHIEKVLSSGAKFSRLDSAFDCFVDEDIILPDEYIGYATENLIDTKPTWKTAPKTIGTWKKDDGETKQQIETLYFGDWKKRAKRGIVRVYDKGIDLGWYANSIIRLEIEEKRANAHMSARRIAEGVSIGSVIKTRFNINDLRWQEAIDSPTIETYRGLSKDDAPDKDVWKWLLETVAPSLGKAIAHDELEGKRQNYELFNLEVQKAYNRVMRSKAI